MREAHRWVSFPQRINKPDGDNGDNDDNDDNDDSGDNDDNDDDNRKDNYKMILINKPLLNAANCSLPLTQGPTVPVHGSIYQMII